MKQFTTPLIVTGSKALALERIDPRNNDYNEDWIQQLCYENPNLLPLDEIEPCFSGSVAICRELETPAGPCDLIYVNEQGYITLVECKLWRNPEARRKVVGQILDYAKELAKWSYERFESACLNGRGNGAKTLVDVMSEYYPDLDERAFTDNVQRNLQKGRFMLLIVGDGIRENMEELAQYLQGKGGLNFTLSMIEMPVYRRPDSDERLVTPRVLAKTREIVRTVIRLKETGTLEEVQPDIGDAQRSTSISEQTFYEQLAAETSEQTARALNEFIDELVDGGLIIAKIGRGKKASLNIKSADDTYNFASIQNDGRVWFYGIVTKTEEIGDRQIGIDYLKSLAQIVNGQFYDGFKPWNWCVRRGDRLIPVDVYLAVKDNWRKLIVDTLERIHELGD